MGIEKIATSATKFCRTAANAERNGGKFIRNLASDTAKVPEIEVHLSDKAIEELESHIKNAKASSDVPLKIGLRRIKSKPLTKNDINKLRQFQGKISNDVMENLSKYMKGKSIPSLTENFAVKKERIIQEFTKTNNRELIIRLKTAKTPEQMTRILLEEEFSGFFRLGKIVSKSGLKHSTLELEQLAHETKFTRSNFIMARERAMHTPSTNPQVIAIENILKEQYGAKFVSLKDDVDMAKQVLKAYEIAAKNGVKVPKNVIVSDFLFMSGEHLDDTILLASENSKRMSLIVNRSAANKIPEAQFRTFRECFKRLPNKNKASTTNDCHVPLHEIMHGEHPSLLAFNKKKIPARYESIKNNVSAYSALSPGTHETFTELNTKRLIDGLNSQEQELYNYLNVLG